MINEDIPCKVILSPINAAKTALHSADLIVFKVYIKHCVNDRINHRDANNTIKNFAKVAECFTYMR